MLVLVATIGISLVAAALISLIVGSLFIGFTKLWFPREDAHTSVVVKPPEIEVAWTSEELRENAVGSLNVVPMRFEKLAAELSRAVQRETETSQGLVRDYVIMSRMSEKQTPKLCPTRRRERPKSRNRDVNRRVYAGSR